MLKEKAFFLKETAFFLKEKAVFTEEKGIFLLKEKATVGKRTGSFYWRKRQFLLKAYTCTPCLIWHRECISVNLLWIPVSCINVNIVDSYNMWSVSVLCKWWAEQNAVTNPGGKLDTHGYRNISQTALKPGVKDA